MAGVSPHPGGPGAASVRPLTEELSEIRFVGSQSLVEKLEELRGLLAHSHPEGKLGELIEVAVEKYLTRHHPEQRAKRAEERKRRREEKSQQMSEGVESLALPKWDSRRPSAAIIRQIILRDGYACS